MAVDTQDQGARFLAVGAGVRRLGIEESINKLGEHLLEPARSPADFQGSDALLVEHVGHQPLQPGRQMGQRLLDQADVA